MDRHLDIKAMAAKAFADHQITRCSGTTWRVGKPNTGRYAFWVTWAPGAIIVTGDLGDMVYRGPNALWIGPWDAARFIAGCDYDYLTGKSSTEQVYDRDATIVSLLQQADERQKYGDLSIWTRICKAHGYDLNPASVTDQMKAAARFREEGVPSAYDACDYTGDFEGACYSYPPKTRWIYEGLMLWAAWAVRHEPALSRLARQRRRLRDWWRGLKRRPPIYRPTLWIDTSRTWSRDYWRRDQGGSFAMLTPFRLFGLDLSRFGLWRDQGSRTPGRYDDKFVLAAPPPATPAREKVA